MTFIGIALLVGTVLYAINGALNVSKGVNRAGAQKGATRSVRTPEQISLIEQKMKGITTNPYQIPPSRTSQILPLAGSFTITNASAKVAEAIVAKDYTASIAAIDTADDAFMANIGKAAISIDFDSTNSFLIIPALCIGSPSITFTDNYEATTTEPSDILEAMTDKDIIYDLAPEIIGKSYYDGGTKRFHAHMSLDVTQEVEAYAKLYARHALQDETSFKMNLILICVTDDNGVAVNFEGWSGINYQLIPNKIAIL